MILSAFLGNKGKKYEQTRHNLAWIMLERLSFFNRLSWNVKFRGEYARSGNPEQLLLKPMTLMNNSGESVSAALAFFKMSPADLLVIHDDLELPFGTVQMKKGGGAGGHNGLRSIIRLTGSSDFYRFRMGISRPPAGRDIASWVLNRFSQEEEAVLDDYCREAGKIFEESVSAGLKAGKKLKILDF